jgi:predicted O-linked N-acetylglucosamine transferase (SPINDLY family)
MVLARRGVCIEPASVDTSLAVAQAEFSYGHLGDAYRWYLRARAIEAGEGVFKWAMLFLHYRPETSSRELFDLHRRWGCGRPRAPAMDWSRKGRRADRPLRIGYVSADLFDHPVGRNAVGLLESHDRSAVEVVVYSARDEDDDVGRRCRAAAHSWRTIANLDDIAAAELIRSDEVDILVFLAGHTFANRISVAAHRAAPIQVSMHDLTTSGLDEMDWFISDETLSPTDGDELFTEKVARLPCFYLHMPLDDLPTTSRDGDGIVLGSCSNPAKLNDEVVATWAEILRRRPEAELRLKYRGAFSDPRLVSDLRRRFRQLEVEPSRVILDVRRTGRRDHLAFVGEFDIALDTFPFNGSTTTYEALWMGVPVVTLVGRRFVGRVGAAILSLVGLEDLIAEDRRSYVDKVLCLTEDKDRRMELRRHLRERLKASPLLDAGAYARSVEGAYRAMWRSWCEGRDMTAPQNRTSASS